MPIYEYLCRDCGKVGEYFIGSRRAEGELSCKWCGGRNLERVLSVVNISVKEGSRGGRTCCGREERCERPPCEVSGSCWRG
ncbi:MAG: hypothetical protein DRG31_05865 [Deltaproteobacteria bacterium]|nr:MAG: hypothetical protein DRG31_05865 [Deltaproteobacteria bacterium]